MPFNSKNILATKHDVDALLAEFVPGQSCANVSLYQKAFTHRSYCSRKCSIKCPPECVPLQPESNERLEFLGDAVLQMVTTAYLYQRYPSESEGFLTRMRTCLVNGDMLSLLCRKCDMSRFILVSTHIEDGKRRDAKDVTEDAFEAFLGALYLDLGYSTVHAWIVAVLERHVDFAQLVLHRSCPKDALNRYMQRYHGALPVFEPASVHSPDAFAVCVRTKDGAVISVGHGASRKHAEEDAARKALGYYRAA